MKLIESIVKIKEYTKTRCRLLFPKTCPFASARVREVIKPAFCSKGTKKKQYSANLSVLYRNLLL